MHNVRQNGKRMGRGLRAGTHDDTGNSTNEEEAQARNEKENERDGNALDERRTTKRIKKWTRWKHRQTTHNGNVGPRAHDVVGKQTA